MGADARGRPRSVEGSRAGCDPAFPTDRDENPPGTSVETGNRGESGMGCSPTMGVPHPVRGCFAPWRRGRRGAMERTSDCVGVIYSFTPGERIPGGPASGGRASGGRACAVTGGECGSPCRGRAQGNPAGLSPGRNLTCPMTGDVPERTMDRSVFGDLIAHVTGLSSTIERAFEWAERKWAEASHATTSGRTPTAKGSRLSSIGGPTYRPDTCGTRVSQARLGREPDGIRMPWREGYRLRSTPGESRRLG
jgi:hypothetical protein